MPRNLQKKKSIQKERRKKRGRIKMVGTGLRPRLSVFRSLKHISAQLIDDERGVTLVSASDLELVNTDRLQEPSLPNAKQIAAKEVGKLVAKKAIAKKINQVIFDRSGLKYHGRVKALAEGAREGGLKF